MNGTRKRFNMAGRLALAAMIVTLSFTTMVFAEGGGRYEVNPWSFGVMADTQWTVGEDPSGENPEYVSAALARAFQQQFINAGVKLVVQVGDLTDRAGDEGFVARAAAAQPLLDAGIGFFPLRGNHETYGYLYGRDPDWNVNVPGWRAAFPQTQGMGTVYGATNFSAPDIDDLAGLSYSFDYANQTGSARFVIVDVEATKFIYSSVQDHPVYGEAWFYLGWTVYKATATVPGGSIPEGAYFRIASSGLPSTNFYGYESYWPFADYIAKEKYDISGTEYWPGMQQEWIAQRLDKSTRGTEHAFVFSHRGLMGANHADGFFGSSPASKAATQTPFYQSLMENGVRYMLSGHDHLHNRALVTDPTGQFQVQQIIHMAGSTKFYAAAALDGFSGAKSRETQISQELFNVGYYVYKIDGPRVTATYYGDRVNDYQDNEEYPDGEDSINGKLYLPPLDFIEKETYGYSTNGRQFLVAQGDSYAAVEDSFGKTRARILAGKNNSTSTDFTPESIDDNDTPDDPSDDVVTSAPRPLNKVVNTGWVPNPDPYTLKSDIFSLWGMSELGAGGMTDPYVLSMSIDFKRMNGLGYGGIGIATFVDGEWVTAVRENFGGTPKFVVGPYKPKYGLGTYGVDPATKTAWAVLNYNADFAVAMDVEPVPGKVNGNTVKNGNGPRK